MLIAKEVTIDRPIKVVFQYVLDFSQLYEWDDHVTEGRRIDLGEIEVGSRFAFRYSLFGQRQDIEYTLEALKENEYLHLRCEALNFSAIDKITFHSLENNQTKVSYTAQISLRSRVGEFLFSPVMECIGKGVVSRLKEVLEGKESLDLKGSPLHLLNVPYRFMAKGWNSRRKKFSATQKQAKKVLITGPTSGIGRSVTFNLAGKGCDLILVGRNHGKLSSLKDELYKRGFNKSVDFYVCDMEDLSAVKSTIARVIADEHKIDVLINNAGNLYAESKSIDGIERTTVVDLIAPWMMSLGLLEIIRPKGGCIINISSGGMYSTGLSIEKLKVPVEPFSGSKAYALAKRGMAIFSAGLNSEVESQSIRVHCMHPGWADTPGVLNSLPGFHKLTKRWLRTPFEGAETIVWLAMHNPKPGGRFWLDRQIQPSHLLESTKGTKVDYQQLHDFLCSFA